MSENTNLVSAFAVVVALVIIVSAINAVFLGWGFMLLMGVLHIHISSEIPNIGYNVAVAIAFLVTLFVRPLSSKAR